MRQHQKWFKKINISKTLKLTVLPKSMSDFVSKLKVFPAIVVIASLYDQCQKNLVSQLVED